MDIDQAASQSLPDIQSTHLNRGQELALEWVGMSRIEAPVQVESSGKLMTLSALIEAGVNLIDAEARGIHMSRLYRAIVDELPKVKLSFSALGQLVESFLESHETLSNEAEIRVQFDALLTRPSLKSSLLGYRTYPVELRSLKRQGVLRNFLRVEVIYASTCPQSAALARALVAQDFAQNFQNELSPSLEVKKWLESEAGMAATPHAQRSVARLEVELKPGSPLSFEELIDLIEDVLATPVQSVVKREDEQEFARRNGTHLMFCEDAARKVKKALLEEPQILGFDGEFRHLESLHPHDAVARIRSSRPQIS